MRYGGIWRGKDFRIPFFSQSTRDVNAGNPGESKSQESTSSGSSPGLDRIEGMRQDGRAEPLRRMCEGLLEGAPDAIFVAETRSGRIIEANRAAESLLETPVQEIIGRHQSDLHPPEKSEAYQSLFERHKEKAKSGPATVSTLNDGSQVYIQSDGGERIPVEINASFIDVGGTELFIGVFRDISERKEQEEELRKAKTEAEKANEFQSVMLRTMNHELRTPLTSIMGYLEVMKEKADGELRMLAEKVQEGSHQLMKTIDSTLELSQLLAGTKDLKREPVRLEQVARNVANAFRPAANEKNIEVKEALPEVPVRGNWNRKALTHIVENLFENAIKFTPEGGTVAVRVRRSKTAAVLEVEDTGIGMTPEDVPRLFEAFSQSSEGLDREGGGSGLGLPVAKKLVERVAGKIEVETQKGEGSCFAVRLPFREKSASQEKASTCKKGNR